VERVWRDGVNYTGPWTKFDSRIRFDISGAGYGWNFGSGAPSSSQIDFRSTVTHELGHSLGFMPSYDGGDDKWGGCWGTSTSPFAFAGYNGLSRWDKKLIDDAGNRAAVGSTGTPGNFDEEADPVWFTGANAVAYYGGNVPVFAPYYYDYGSSLSHLDDISLPNALMSPYASAGVMNRSPTRVEAEIMKDLGWSVQNKKVWTRGAGSANWVDAANWNPVGAPDASWDLVLNGVNLVSGATMYLGGNQAVNLLTIDATKDFTLGGTSGTLTIVKANLVRTAASSGTQTLARPVALGASAVWDIAGSGQLAVSGVISGTGFALEKRGPGTLLLAAANTYTAGTTVSAGTLLVSNTTGSGTGPGAVTVGAATLGGTGFINGPVTLTGDSTLTSTGTLTISNTLTVQGLANQLSSGTVLTTGDVTISPGAVFIINGTLGGNTGNLIVYGILMGKGTINKSLSIAAGGTLSPGAPSSVKSMSQVLVGAAPQTFSFEIGAASPNYSQPADSTNDVLRITSQTLPFANAAGDAPAALTADTVIDVYFIFNDPPAGQYDAEFFAETDYTDAVRDATFQYWRLDPRGSRLHNGNFFSPLDESLVDWSVVPETAAFAGAEASGYITEFAVVPEPATLALLTFGAALVLRRRKQESPPPISGSRVG
jgi:autotransporter-associated beta strand protein